MGIYTAKASSEHSGGTKATGSRGRLEESYVNDVRSRADVVDVIQSRGIQLKKSGSNFMGLCPFHGEKSPSFSVSQTKQFYHCFGCGKSGSALDFVMEFDGRNFQDATIHLGESMGMQPRFEGQSSEDQQKFQERRDFESKAYELMDHANQFFRHSLRFDEPAKDFLRSRHITPAIVNVFKIGYAPNEWQGLSEALGENYSSAVAQSIGLVRTGQNGGRKFDFFRHRITFPVRDIRGRIIAFGARQMPGSEEKGGKYINSPDSILFNKSATLYGIYEAQHAIRKHKSAIMVEGYIDVVMCHQQNICNVVATMGTACTPSHLNTLINMGAESLVFAFDGDAAGQNAAWKMVRSCLPLLDTKLNFLFAFMPQGKDPDDVARELGEKQFIDFIERSSPLLDFLFAQLKVKHNNLESISNRNDFSTEANSMIQLIPYRSQAYRIAKQQIANMTGLSLASVNYQSAQERKSVFTKNRSRHLWDRLSRAIDKAPNTALLYRASLTDALDPEDEDQARLIAQLNTVSERPDEDDALYVEDVKNGVALINSLLIAQMNEQLREDLANNVITAEQFMEKRHELNKMIA